MKLTKIINDMESKGWESITIVQGNDFNYKCTIFTGKNNTISKTFKSLDFDTSSKDKCYNFSYRFESIGSLKGYKYYCSNPFNDKRYINVYLK